VGPIESPTGRGLRPAAGTDVAIRGYVVDLSAQGWAGVDQVSVYNGMMSEGKKVADATIGQSRSDVRDAFGYAPWANSGFSVTLPGKSVTEGTWNLTVNAHTPDKGWFYKPLTLTVSGSAAMDLPYPNDPIAVIVTPINGDNINVNPKVRYSNSCRCSRFTFSGYALDRNPIGENPNSSAIVTPYGFTGIDRQEAYMDGPRGVGIAFGAKVSDNEDIGPGAAGKPALFAGKYGTAAEAFGPQFKLAGWKVSMGVSEIPLGSHTFYYYARSAVTGKWTEAHVTANFFDPEKGNVTTYYPNTRDTNAPIPDYIKNQGMQS